jgi:hypothetical protein
LAKGSWVLRQGITAESIGGFNRFCIASLEISVLGLTEHGSRMESEQVQNNVPDRGIHLWSLNLSGWALAATLLTLSPESSRADESGVSFWLPGQVDSLPAVPGVPGWSLATVYYHTTVGAFGAVAAAREI